VSTTFWLVQDVFAVSMFTLTALLIAPVAASTHADRVAKTFSDRWLENACFYAVRSLSMA
jgi:hypothetical protein